MQNSRIRLTKNSLDMLYQIRDGKIMRLLTGDGNKSVYFFGENEFRLSLEKNGQTKLIRSRECETVDIRKRSGSLVISYDHELFFADVLYKIKDGVLYKTLTLTAKTPFLLKQMTTETFRVKSELKRGGEGQPVFAGGDMFIGAEFPSACNGFTGDQLDITQYPYIQLEKGGVFDSFDVVFGFRGGETAEQAFEAHIKAHACKKGGTLKIYSDWGLHDELSDNIRLDDKMVKDMIGIISDLRRKDRVNFDYYLMDAFWWEDGGRYIDFKKSAWPDGISEIIGKLADAGLKFGLWFDVNMAMVKLPESESSLRDGCGRFCLADKRTVELLKTAVLYHIKNTGIKMIKFDFAYFDCENPDHSFHARGGAQSKEPAIRNFTEMIRELRKAEPDLKILCYNGFTTDLSWIGSVVLERSGYAVSPWWAYFADYVYCGDPRASEIPSEHLDRSIIYYTDAMIRQMRDALLPFEFIDDSGTMCANTGTIYYLGKATFRDGWIMGLSRGSRKLHFYGDLGLLDNDDRAFLKQAEKMFDRISGARFRTGFILSDPAKGQPYGYSTTDGTEGIVTVVNPSASAETVNISLNEWTDGKNVKIRPWYSDNEIRAGTEYKNILKVFQAEVGPQSVTSFWWTADNCRDSGQYLRIALFQDDVASIPVSDNTQTVSVSFQDQDGAPLRTLNGIPDGVTLEYDHDLLEQAPKRRPWSGLSWVILKRTGISGDTVCTFENKSDRKVTVLWKEERGSDNGL